MQKVKQQNAFYHIISFILMCFAISSHFLSGVLFFSYIFDYNKRIKTTAISFILICISILGIYIYKYKILFLVIVLLVYLYYIYHYYLLYRSYFKSNNIMFYTLLLSIALNIMYIINQILLSHMFSMLTMELFVIMLLIPIFIVSIMLAAVYYSMFYEVMMLWLASILALLILFPLTYIANSSLFTALNPAHLIALYNNLHFSNIINVLLFLQQNRFHICYSVIVGVLIFLIRIVFHNKGILYNIYYIISLLTTLASFVFLRSIIYYKLYLILCYAFIIFLIYMRDLIKVPQNHIIIPWILGGIESGDKCGNL